MSPFVRKEDYEILYASEVNDIYTAIESTQLDHDADIDAIEQSLTSKANTVHTHTVSDITAMGDKNSTTFLRGDDSWARPADTKVELMPMFSGRAYSTITHGLGRSGAGSLVSLASNTLIMTPLQVPDDVTMNAIGIHNGTAVVGGFIRLGIFTFNLATYTANLFHDCGTVTTDTVGDKQITINVPVDAGLYWLGCVASTTTTIMQGPSSRGIAHSSSYNTVAALSKAYTYAAFTSTITSVSGVSVNMPFMHVGIA